MTAKEMFEKLDYDLYRNDSRITYEKYDKNDNCKMIEFIDMKLKIVDEDNEVYELSLEELQAINKQVEELGWK